jgi:formate dehydrogenase iron-sulfur subunit
MCHPSGVVSGRRVGANEELPVKRLFVDLDRCIGCGSCAAACARVLGGTSAIRYAELSPQVEIPSVCRHCTDAPCLNACPTGAVVRAEDGVVSRDLLMCVGCRSCALACPFGALADDLQDRAAVKCNLCAARVERGQQPACTASCASGARTFEEIADVGADRRRVVVGADALGHNPYRRR